MISNDKNIERIADFVEEVKHWISLRSDYTKLDIIDKVVRILTALTLTFVFLILLLLILIYSSFAVAYALADIYGNMPLAFCSVSLFYLLMLFAFYIKRHAWIEKPLIKFLVSVLGEENK